MWNKTIFHSWIVVCLILVFSSVVFAQTSGEWINKDQPWRANNILDLVIGTTVGNTYKWAMQNDLPHSYPRAYGGIYRRLYDSDPWTRWIEVPCLAIEGCAAHGNMFMYAEDGPSGYANAVYFTSQANGVYSTWYERDNGLLRNNMLLCMTIDTTTIRSALDDTFTCYIGFVAGPSDPSAVYKTINGGRTWAAVGGNSLTRPQAVKDINISVLNPQHLIIGSSGDGHCGIWVSTDGGSSWSQKMSAQSITTVALSSNNDSVMYAAYTKIWKSTNAGQTWNEIYNSHGIEIKEIEVLSRNPDGRGTDTLIAVLDTFDKSKNVIWSTDSGNNWELRYDLCIGQGYCIEPDNNDPSYLLLGGEVSLSRSTDMGESWTESPRGIAKMQLTAVDAQLPNIFVESNYRSIADFSSNASATFDHSFVYYNGSGGTDAEMTHFFDNGEMWLTMTDVAEFSGGAAWATDSLCNCPDWELIALSDPYAWRFEVVNFIKNNVILGSSTAYSVNLNLSELDFGSWNSWYTTDAGPSTVFDIAVKSEYMAVATTDYGTYRTVQSGGNWEYITNNLPTYSTRVRFGNDDICYVGTTDGIWKSWNINSGDPYEIEWLDRSYGLLEDTIVALAVNPVNKSVLYTSTTTEAPLNGYAYISADSGRSWISRSRGFSGDYIKDFDIDENYPDSTYAATYDGIYMYRDNVWSGVLDEGLTQWGPGMEIIQGDVTVPSEGTLNIVAPCTLLFVYNFDIVEGGSNTGKSELNVHGTLRALGNSNDLIVFMSSDPLAPEKGDWYAIKADSGSVDSLAYCIIKQAEYGIKAYKPSILNVEHCDIEENTTAGIYMDHPPNSARIRYSRILNCVTYGIYNLLGSTLISYDTLENSRIGVWAYGGSPTIDHCKITFTPMPYNSYIGIETGSYQSIGTSAIQASFDTIYGFNQGGIYFNAVSSQGSITDCRIVSCGEIGVFFNGCSPFIGSGSAAGYTLISGNTTGIDMGKGSSPTVRRTKLSKNIVVGANIPVGCWPDFGSSNDYGNNSFIANSPLDGYKYHIYNGNTTTLNALYNYWSPLNAALIHNVIYSPYLNNDPLPRIAPPMRENPNMPEELELATAYPNPFNPTTTIEFNLNSPQQVSVDIYNIMGQKVRDLSDEYRQEGTVSLIWDGKDNIGQVAATGVYFCTILTETKQQTLKLTILK
jgi:photosystem II stability/assembly factor-like uncharacterized protein